MTAVSSTIPAQSAAPQPVAGYLPRSTWLPLPFVIPVLLCGLSWVLGGQRYLTDLGFLSLTALCAASVIQELAHFSRRFGVGGLVLFGGTLVWFCFDYLAHWLGVDPARSDYTAEVVAKAACLYSLFIFCAVAGLLIPGGRWLERTMHLVPEPTSQNFYFLLLLLLNAIGLCPYLFLTRDPWYRSIFIQMTGGYGQGPDFTIAREGASINFSWAAGFVGQMIHVGFFAGQFGSFYAILVARRSWQRALGWGIWGFWVLMAVGTGARSNTVVLAFPAIALLYVKHHAAAAMMFKRFSPRAYILATAVGLVLLVLVQYQAFFRTTAFADRDISNMSLSDVQGNAMFTEGLLGYELVPDQEPFYYDQFPGETILRPIPQTLFWLAVGPIPRPLWRSKPVDPVVEWYSHAVTGETSDLETGRTGVSRGLVGNWYFPFGIPGVIEGALLFGWALVVAERAFQHAEGKPMRMIFSLGVLLFLFRSFRDINWQFLYPLVIAAGLLWVLVKIEHAINGAPVRR